MSLYLQVFVIFFLFNGTNFQSSPLKTTTYEQRPVTMLFPKGNDADVIIFKDDVIYYNVKWNYDGNRILLVQGSTLSLKILSPVVNDSGIYSHNGFSLELLVEKSPPPTELPASIKETDVSTSITKDLVGLMITLIVLLILDLLVHIWNLLSPFIRKCDIPKILSQATNSSGDETAKIINVEERGSIDNQSAEQRMRNIENKLDSLSTCFRSFKDVCLNSKSDKPSIEGYQVEDVDGTVETI